MRNIVVAVSLLAIFIGSLYENNYLAIPNEIIWSDSVKLDWADFGGLELPGKEHELQIRLTGSQKIAFMAVTITDIVYDKRGGDYIINAVFYRGRSFYKIFLDGLKPTDESLRHELYHFHITELVARFVRRDLREMDKPLTESNIEFVLQNYEDKADSASKAYDKFTSHGINVANQKAFENSIDSLLSLSSGLR